MTSPLSPRNENGQPVDWWFAYKVPKIPAAHNEHGTTGYEYIYFDHATGKMTLSPHLMTDKESILHQTLDPVLKAPSDTTGWILYNDEMPDEAQRTDSGSYGHTKGVIAFDTATESAFWLLHSWPKYSSPGATLMPVPTYGQTFLCIALDLATAGNIAAQMYAHQEPQVYLPRIPASIDAAHPLHILANGVNLSAEADSDVIDCSSRSGMSFKVIAKNRKWGKDFWNDLVGPSLGSDMDVETWIRGAIPPVLDSDGVHKVFDVKYIDLRPLGFPFTWPETRDHAKWGLTTVSDWICVGDINRMISQEKRGGGTIAFQNADVWSALKQTDLIVPPPGYSVADTKTLIKSTHHIVSHHDQ